MSEHVEVEVSSLSEAEIRQEDVRTHEDSCVSSSSSATTTQEQEEESISKKQSQSNHVVTSSGGDAAASFDADDTEVVFLQPKLPRPHPVTCKVSSSTTTGSSSGSPGEKKADSSTHPSSSTGGSHHHKEKSAQEKKEKYNAILSSLNYHPPQHGSSCADERYNMEVLKNGTIVDFVKFSREENKGYYIIGRVPGCDIVAENPTVSRLHAILQFVQNPAAEERKSGTSSEEVVDKPVETGLYLYDLKSTHGTFINKNQVFPQRFYRVHVGHVLKFGSSQRMYIVNGPDEDEEEESDKSVTELMNEKLQKDLERKRLEEETQLKINPNSKLPNENIEEEGINWGMAEDADAESDLRVNPFAMDYDASELTLDNPKKTLKSWFEREGHDLEYEVREKGNGQYVCRIGLPLDGPTDAPVYAESEVKGKKKEAAHDAAMRACQILDSHGLLRSSNQESRKRKEKRLEDDDYYSSDEDTYLDRTGTIEKKREKRMRLAGKLEEKVETYETLCAKHSELESEITEIQGKLDKAQKVKSRADDGDIDIDDYMQMLKADMFDVKKLRSRLREANEELQRTKKLMDITKPAELPAYLQPSHNQPKPNARSVTKTSSPQATATVTASTKDEEAATKDEEPMDVPEANNKFPVSIEKPKRVMQPSKETDRNSPTDAAATPSTTAMPAPATSRLKPMVGPMKPPSSTPSPKQKLYGLIMPSDISALKKATLRSQESDDFKKPSPNQQDEEENETLEKGDSSSDEEDQLEFTAASKPKRKRQRNRNQKKKPDTFDSSSNSNYTTWVPPSNQSGDGRTSLNDKLGY